MEQVFSNTSPPEPSLTTNYSTQPVATSSYTPLPPVKTNLPDEFMRGGGCLANDETVFTKNMERYTVHKTRRFIQDCRLLAYDNTFDE